MAEFEYRKCALCGCIFTHAYGSLCPDCLEAVEREEEESMHRHDKKDSDNGDD